MRVERVVLAAVVHDDQVPVAPKPPRVEHLTRCHRDDPGTFRHIYINPVPERLGSEARMNLRAVLPDDPPVGGPRKPAAKSSKSRTRHAIDRGNRARTARRRGL